MTVGCNRLCCRVSMLSPSHAQQSSAVLQLQPGQALRDVTQPRDLCLLVQWPQMMSSYFQQLEVASSKALPPLHHTLGDTPVPGTVKSCDWAVQRCSPCTSCWLLSCLRRSTGIAYWSHTPGCPYQGLFGDWKLCDESAHRLLTQLCRPLHGIRQDSRQDGHVACAYLHADTCTHQRE